MRAGESVGLVTVWHGAQWRDDRLVVEPQPEPVTRRQGLALDVLQYLRSERCRCTARDIAVAVDHPPDLIYIVLSKLAQRGLVTVHKEALHYLTVTRYSVRSEAAS